MGSSGMYIGIGITIVAIVIVFLFTNIFDLAKPQFEQTIDSAKEVISKVEGKDVVSGAEVVSSKILNETSKIVIKNPIP
ncbi:MAG: hypothetical protein HW410_1014 [Nitrosarchaeum sp.]|nr:hypothetical protein [Nitrosarchaeum sp.]